MAVSKTTDRQKLRVYKRYRLFKAKENQSKDDAVPLAQIRSVKEITCVHAHIRHTCALSIRPGGGSNTTVQEIRHIR